MGSNTQDAYPTRGFEPYVVSLTSAEDEVDFLQIQIE